MVVITVSIRACNALHHFHNGGGQRELRAKRRGGIQRIRQIFNVQIDTETA